MKAFFMLIGCFAVAFGMLFAATNSDMEKLDQEIQEFKTARDQIKMKADIASRNADRMMTENWVEYRHEIERQDDLQSQIEALDSKIASLEKQKQDLLAKKP